MRLGGKSFIFESSAQAVALLLACALAFSPARARAESEYDHICSTQPSDPSVVKQRDFYCTAAKGAQDGMIYNAAVLAVWAGIFGICTAACIQEHSLGAGALASQVNPINKRCDAANFKGKIVDFAYSALIEKDFQALLTNFAKDKVISAVTHHHSEEDPQGNPKADQSAACKVAMVAGLRALSIGRNIVNDRSQAKNNLKMAGDLLSQNPVAGRRPALNEDQVPSGSPSGAPGSAPAMRDNAVAQNGNSPDHSDPCGGLGSSQAIVACAVSSDQVLPGYVGTNGFVKDVKNMSGQDLSDLGHRALESPAASVLASAGVGFLSGAQATALASTLNNIDEAMPAGTLVAINEKPLDSGFRSVGSRTSASDGTDHDPDLAGLMKKMMDGLGAGPGAEAPLSSGVQAVAFANQKRGPASIPEDRSLSIFDRVTYRYLVRGADLMGERTE